MKKNIPLKKRQGYHGFLKKYHNVYLFIAILVGCGILMGIIVSNYIDVSDIKSLSSYLTTIDSGVDKYDYFVSQFFSGIVFILFVFLHTTYLSGFILNFFVKYDQLKGLRLAPCYGRMQMHTKNVKERRHSDEKETYDTDGC